MQSALGGDELYRKPFYATTKIAKVLDNKDYDKLGRINVVCIDYSTEFPVWVVGDIDRKPEKGDMVVIGYLDGRRDAPYLAGYVKGASHASDYIQIRKDFIKLCLPGVTGGSGQAQIRIDKDGIVLYHPKGVVLADENTWRRITDE